MRHARSHDPLEEDALAITLAGHVQGVGFRPFVYRLAGEHGITGQVQNRCGEVHVVACGPSAKLSQFCNELVSLAPPLSRPRIVKQQPHSVERFADFQIVESASDTAAQVFLPPDYFMCDDCCRELHDPEDRRYHYPFINCTQCGPRYTLIESLPYDRPNTSMAEFPLCQACEEEYRSPADRRFHAEPVACQVCGPALEFVANDGRTSHAALDAALRYLRDGRILAIKGIGGYHLVCDAQDGSAVATLRERKHRPDKPLAVMFPHRGGDGLSSVRSYATLSEAEAQLLTSPLRPIVLVEKSGAAELAPDIAPGLAEIGVFLPYSPLHELILDALDRPVVATSGNISGEPVLIDNAQAEADLGSIADGFLHHNRRILRPADDSVYRKSAGSMRPIRVGRGAAPVEFKLPWRQSRPTLAVGGHTKVTIALGWRDRVVVSPHIGDMDSPKSLATLERLSGDLQSLYGVMAERVVCDAHSGYTTHRWAQQRTGLPVTTVWHHHAHASALVAEGQIRGPSVVFVWDGVGLGEDGTLWGGEAFQGTVGAWQRVASLRPFRLPGGECAGREPWRSAAALLWECGQAWAECPDSTGLVATAWRQQLNCPTTSAAGRLFDAAAALILETHSVSYEAGAPMQLEAVCRRRREPVELPLQKGTDGIWRSDWEAVLPMLQDGRVSPVERAEMFHSSMAHAVLAQARAIRDDSGIRQVGLCGGVFQNRILTDEVVDLLQRDGFDVHLPERLPCNDAALCVGQIAEATVSPLRAAS